MAKTQRQGVASRLVFLKETAWNDDTGITAGQVFPLSEASGVESKQDLIKVPNFPGGRLPAGAVTGNATVEGSIPVNMEFKFLGHMLHSLVGNSGYTKTTVGTTKYNHRFVIPTADGALPQSFQLEQQSLESPITYLRYRGCFLSNLQFTFAQSGGATYTANIMGSGSEARTTLDASPDYYGFDAVSYFNGYARLNNLNLVGMSDYSFTLENNLARVDTAFNGGIASGVTAGLMDGNGTLGLIMGVASGSDPEDIMTFYDYAVNQTDIPLEVLYCDKPTALSTQWCRVRSYVRFQRRSWKPGGAAGLMISQDYQLIPSLSADWAGEIHNSIGAGATFNIPASAKLGVKIDGGSTQPINITQGAARTVAQVVADLSGLTGGAADVWNGHIRIKSSTTGAASSVQIDTGQVDTCHTVLGFDGTSRVGLADTPFIIDLFNAQSASY